MKLHELVSPFELARLDRNALKDLAEALGNVSGGLFLKLQEVLSDVENKRYPLEKRANAWLEYYRLGGFRGNELLLAKVDWIEPYLKLLISLKAPGYEDLRNLNANLEEFRSLGTWDSLISDSMLKDSFTEFMLHCDLVGLELKRGHIQELFENDEMLNISLGVIKKAPWLRKEFTPREMLLFVCACCPSDEKSVALAEAIESVAPGQAKAVDVNGWTPLTYSLFKCKNFKNGNHRFVQAPQLEKWLVEHGCNPRQKDKYGLSWFDLRVNMPGGKMYNFSKIFGGKSFIEIEGRRFQCDK